MKLLRCIVIVFSTLSLLGLSSASFSISTANEQNTVLAFPATIPTESEGVATESETPQEITQAIETYEQVLASDPNNSDALAGLGEIYRNLGNFTTAKEYYDKALAINPRDAFAINGKGDIFSTQGDFVEARKFYEQALAIDKTNKYALFSIGWDLDTQGNYTGAIEYFDKALDINPGYTDAINAKAAALAKMAGQ